MGGVITMSNKELSHAPNCRVARLIKRKLLIYWALASEMHPKNFE